MEKYTKKIFVPQYEPKEVTKKNSRLYDDKKYKELVKEIQSSVLDEEEKNFLLLSATRHIIFNYSNIADYYANVANEEMQKLMEKSALVIIDVEDAIANGYVRLSKRIDEIVDSRKED